MDQVSTLRVLPSDRLYKGDHFTLSLRLELSQTTTLSMHNPIHLIPLLSIDQLTVIEYLLALYLNVQCIGLGITHDYIHSWCGASNPLF